MKVRINITDIPGIITFFHIFFVFVLSYIMFLRKRFKTDCEYGVYKCKESGYLTMCTGSKVNYTHK